MAGFRIAIGGDDAGFAYKETLIKDLNADERVSEVIDVGPNSASDKTAYPHFAIAAAELVAAGKADRARKGFSLSLFTVSEILGVLYVCISGELLTDSV